MVNVWQVVKTVVAGVVRGRNGLPTPVSRARGSAASAAAFRTLAAAVCVFFLVTAIWPSRGNAQENSHQYCASVQIQLSGSGVITNQTITRYVGEENELTGSYTLPTGANMTSVSWSGLSGTVAGYTANSLSASVNSAVSTTSPSTTFYWLAPTTAAVTVTFTLNWQINGGSQSTKAKAYFNVNGVSSNPLSVVSHYGTVTIDQLTGCSNASSGPALVYGDITSGPMPPCSGTTYGTAGIYLYDGGATPPESGGSFSYVQTVGTDDCSYTENGTTYSGSATPGLDSTFPYLAVNSNGQATDAPEAPLPSTASAYTRTFSAKMWLFWMPPGAGSVYVPVGYIQWGFSGSATQSGGTWTPAGSDSQNSFTPTNGNYPTWSGFTGQCNPS